MTKLQHLKPDVLGSVIDTAERWAQAYGRRQHEIPFNTIRNGIVTSGPEALAWAIEHPIPEAQELAAVLGERTIEERAELVALMWYGRDGGGEERVPFKVSYSASVEAASDGYVPYMMKLPLADYLRRGLANLSRG